MLQPARRKFRKEHKGRNRGVASTGNKVSFGEFGLKAIGRGRITARQIEAARRVMTRRAEFDSFKLVSSKSNTAAVMK